MKPDNSWHPFLQLKPAIPETQADVDWVKQFGGTSQDFLGFSDYSAFTNLGGCYDCCLLLVACFNQESFIGGGNFLLGCEHHRCPFLFLPGPR